MHYDNDKGGFTKSGRKETHDESQPNTLPFGSRLAIIIKTIQE